MTKGTSWGKGGCAYHAPADGELVHDFRDLLRGPAVHDRVVGCVLEEALAAVGLLEDHSPVVDELGVVFLDV